VHVSIPQQIHNSEPSISVADHGNYRIACYFNSDKYARPEIAEYYSRMVSHIRDGLGFEIQQAQSMEELKQIITTRTITHIFIAEWEYRMEQKYFEDMGKKYYVNVFADHDFEALQGSSIRVMRKPVYIMSVVNLLKATTPGSITENVEKKLAFPQVKALVVDDDRMNLTVVKGVLKSYQIEADTCLSGAAAIDKCRSEDYQIIFMDHMMPGMNGIEAMQKIRMLRKGYYQNIPIVVLTANAVSGAREMFMKEGFDEFVSKPIELSEMSRTLRKMLIEREA
jgi:CheY-like chemotaxis protein